MAKGGFGLHLSCYHGLKEISIHGSKGKQCDFSLVDEKTVVGRDYFFNNGQENI